MPFFPARPVRPLRWSRALPVGRKVGVDHKAEVGQVQPARGDVGGHTDPCATIAQSLQGVGAFPLAHLARKGHGVEPAFPQGRVQVAHRLRAWRRKPGRYRLRRSAGR